MDINVHNITPGEVLAMFAVELQAWPKNLQAPPEKLKSRIANFSEGVFGAYDEGHLVADTTSQIIEYNPETGLNKSWSEITDGGFISGTHNPAGNALYIVSITVIPKYQGHGIGTKLIEKQKELAREKGLEYVLIGFDLEGYDEYNNSEPISIENYVNLKRNDQQPFDPKIRFYTRCGLELINIIPNFSAGSAHAAKYGVMFQWKNPELVGEVTE